MPVETRIVTEARLHPDAEWTVLGPGAVELDRLREALENIRDADPVDMALDPGWPARIAAAALKENQRPERAT